MSKLNVGDVAPAITAVDQHGNPFSLNSLQGKKVILYFYPKDDTPGCTAEACNFRDNYDELRNSGYEVVGVSTDPVKAHQKFVEKYELPFTLVSDNEKKVVEDYGVWGPKKFMGKEYMGTSRVTFVIDEQGKIANIINKVETKDSTAQVLKAMQA